MSAARYARIAGTGSYLPKQRVSNQDLVARLAKEGLETSDEWIQTRSGISARHFAAEHELTSDLAVKAAQAALQAASCDVSELISSSWLLLPLIIWAAFRVLRA